MRQAHGELMPAHARRSSWGALCAQAVRRDGALRCNYHPGMSDLRFEWAGDKAADNARKHGVTVEEAETVFTDEFGILLDDPDHSIDEDRFVLLGLSGRARITSHGLVEV